MHIFNSSPSMSNIIVIAFLLQFFNSLSIILTWAAHINTVHLGCGNQVCLLLLRAYFSLLFPYADTIKNIYGPLCTHPY